MLYTCQSHSKRRRLRNACAFIRRRTALGKDTLRFFEDKITPAIESDMRNYFAKNGMEFKNETALQTASATRGSNASGIIKSSFNSVSLTSPAIAFAAANFISSVIFVARPSKAPLKIIANFFLEYDYTDYFTIQQII